MIQTPTEQRRWEQSSKTGVARKTELQYCSERRLTFHFHPDLSPPRPALTFAFNNLNIQKGFIRI
jgi:hypothetical protein